MRYVVLIAILVKVHLSTRSPPEASTVKQQITYRTKVGARDELGGERAAGATAGATKQEGDRALASGFIPKTPSPDVRSLPDREGVRRGEGPDGTPTGTGTEFSQDGYAVGMRQLTPCTFLATDSTVQQSVYRSVDPLALVTNAVDGVGPEVVRIATKLVISLQGGYHSM